jgi:hypothetical protein
MRTSSRARVVLLLTVVWALAAATASAQSVLYLRSGTVLSENAPQSGAATAALSTRIPGGEDTLLGTFVSAPLDHDLVVDEVRGVVFLGTGRPGMDGCAHVSMVLSRLTAAPETIVASGTLTTSIRPRRKVSDPVIVPMGLSAPLVAGPGDRLAFYVTVGNECGGERSVAILYDSVSRASRVELVLPGPSTTTTSTTTPSSTTTTLPPSCLDTATGLAGVRCRLETMDGIVRAASPASLGGPRFLGRLGRRIDRALTFVRAAELVDATPRRLRKGRGQVMRFVGQLARGRATGRVAPEVGDPLASLAEGAAGGLSALLVGK